MGIVICLGVSLLSATGCDFREGVSAPTEKTTTLNFEEGIPSLESRNRAPFYVVISPENTARIWRADSDAAVVVDAKSIGSALAKLNANPTDELVIYAEHNPPHTEILRIAERLRDQGYREIALVTPGGWVPSVPSLEAD